ncbi:MAG TPA: cupin domain-containing protein [Chitinophagaceae bacterium]
MARTAAENEAAASLEATELNRIIDEIKSDQIWQQKDRHSITVYKAATMRIVVVGLHSGAELKTHTANGTISVQVLKGLMRFESGGKVVDMREGMLLTLAEMVPHSVIALEETFFLLTMAMKD